MAIKLGNGKYQCLFCDFIGTTPSEVDSHRDRTHQFIMLPLLKEDLARLIQFIYTKDENLITPRLYKLLKAYNNAPIPERLSYEDSSD